MYCYEDCCYKKNYIYAMLGFTTLLNSVQEGNGDSWS